MLIRSKAICHLKLLAALCGLCCATTVTSSSVIATDHSPAFDLNWSRPATTTFASLVVGNNKNARGAQASNSAVNELAKLQVMPSRQYKSYSETRNLAQRNMLLNKHQTAGLEHIVDAGGFHRNQDELLQPVNRKRQHLAQRRTFDAFSQQHKQPVRLAAQSRKMQQANKRSGSSMQKQHDQGDQFLQYKREQQRQLQLLQQQQQLATATDLENRDEPMARREWRDQAKAGRARTSRLATQESVSSQIDEQRERERAQNEEDDFFKDEESSSPRKRSGADQIEDDDDDDDEARSSAQRAPVQRLNTARTRQRPLNSYFNNQNSYNRNNNNNNNLKAGPSSSIDSDEDDSSSDEDVDATALDMKRVQNESDQQNNNNNYLQQQLYPQGQASVSHQEVGIAAAVESLAPASRQADLQTAAGHHHKHSHGHYYQHVEVPKKGAWKFGFKRGNHKHEIERHEKGHKHKFHSSFKWHAKEKCKKKKKCKSVGKMTWHYEHAKKHHHG